MGESRRERPEPTWRRYLRLARPDVAADVDDEVRFHLDMRSREFEARGLSPEEARRRADERFGDRERVARWLRAHDQRRQRAAHWRDTMHSILRDIRYAARSLRRSPALSLIAVFALALGIGLTTTMYSIVYGVIMKGLPFDHADRIVVVKRSNPSRGFRLMSMPIHDYLDYTSAQRSFTGLAAYKGGTVNVSGAEKAERYNGSWVTANTFSLVGAKPLLGRDFRLGEDTPGAEPVAMIGYAMWKNRFASDPAIVGRTIRVNALAYTVIGVMPERFLFPNGDDLWLNLQLDPLTIKRGGAPWLEVWGRLRPGVTVAMASSDVNATARRLQTEYKESNDGIEAGVLSFVEGSVGPEAGRLLYTMLGAVFCVLLIACANVANLLLDRAAHKTKEVGIRTALGASRAAVVRQVLVEALVLATSGALLGVAAAHVGIDAFNRAIADNQPPYYIDIGLYPPVLLFAAIVALAATAVSGAIPAIQSAQADITGILKDESRGASSFRIGRMSRAVVVFEIALSCTLLVAAGLMIKSVTKLRSMDPGFSTKNIFTARIGFPGTNVDTATQERFFDDLRGRLAALPGVQSVALVSILPGVGDGTMSFAVEGTTYARDKDYPTASVQAVSAGFFATFGIPVTQGRPITPQDRDDALPVAVVSRAFAARFYHGQDPVGRRIRVGTANSKERWRTIVGVVPDVYSGDSRHPDREHVYTPLPQDHSNFVSIAIRAASAPLALTPQVRETVASLDADRPIYSVLSMEEAIARPLWFVRVFGTMFTVFGLIALFLASVGLYSVMAFSVSRRTREVGIRMALGAQAHDVIRMIFGQGLLQIGTGMIVGLAAAAGAVQLMTIVLFDVQPRDPVVFASVVAVLAATGLLACYVPARRATRIDPLLALRSE